MLQVPAVKLNNGVEMPTLGFGVFQVPDLSQAEKAVSEALETGYRLIDTAAAYQNEEAVGKAIKNSSVNREDIFVTSNLWVSDFSYEGAKRGIDTSLENLAWITWTYTCYTNHTVIRWVPGVLFKKHTRLERSVPLVFITSTQIN